MSDELKIKVGDMVLFNWGSKGKKSYGIITNIFGANVRLDDKYHYKKSILVQQINLERVVTEVPTDLDGPVKKPPMKTVTTVTVNEDGEEVTTVEEKKYSWQVEREIPPEPIRPPKPPRDLAGPVKTKHYKELSGRDLTKEIAGIPVTLPAGNTYSLSVPMGHEGAANVYACHENRCKEVVLIIDMYQNDHKRFFEEFPRWEKWV